MRALQTVEKHSQTWPLNLLGFGRKTIVAAVTILSVFPATTGVAGACSPSIDEISSVDEMLWRFEENHLSGAWKAEVVATVEPFTLPIFEDWTRTSAEVPVTVWGKEIPDPRVSVTYNKALRRPDECSFGPGNGNFQGSVTYYVIFHDSDEDYEVRLPLYGGWDAEAERALDDVTEIDQLETLLTTQFGEPLVIRRDPAADAVLLDGVSTQRWKDPRALAGRIGVPAFVVLLIIGWRRRARWLTGRRKGQSQTARSSIVWGPSLRGGKPT